MITIKGNLAIEVAIKPYNSLSHECNYERYDIVYDSDGESVVIGEVTLLFTYLKLLEKNSKFNKVTGENSNEIHKQIINKQFKHLNLSGLIHYALSQTKKNSDLFFLITDFRIDENYRGKGIGHFVIEFLIKNIIERTGGFIALIADNDSIAYTNNDHLIRFYKRLGFDLFKENSNILYYNLLTD